MSVNKYSNKPEQSQAIARAGKKSGRPSGGRVAVSGLLHELNLNMKALHIAAQIMQADGLCRYEDRSQCKKKWPPPPDDVTCVRCIENWLLAKARKELRHGRL